VPMLFISTSSFSSWYLPIKVIFRGSYCSRPARQKAKIDHFRPKMTKIFHFFPKMNQNLPFYLVPAEKIWSQQRKSSVFDQAESATIRHSKGAPPHFSRHAKRPKSTIFDRKATKLNVNSFLKIPRRIKCTYCGSILCVRFKCGDVFYFSGLRGSGPGSSGLLRGSSACFGRFYSQNPSQD
jgi:hypothetical protein